MTGALTAFVIVSNNFILKIYLLNMLLSFSYSSPLLSSTFLAITQDLITGSYPRSEAEI
jgi:hypothetical protein